MIYNINDIIREKIYNKSTLEFFLYFDTLSKNEKEFLFRIILSDYYKTLYVCEISRLEKIDDDVIEFLDFCIEEPKAFIHILNGAKTFYDMAYVSKIITIEKIEELNQDLKLLSISKTHILDKLTYRLIDEPEYYKEYYIDYVKKNNRVIEAKKVILDFFTLKIIELEKLNNKLYQKMFLEFIKNYYKWKVFIKEHEGEYLLNPEDFYYIDVIKNKNIDELFIFLKKNHKFFITMINEFFHYSTENIEIPEKMVDEYFESSSDDKLKQKLKKRE